MFKGKKAIVDPSIETKSAHKFNYKTVEDIEYERERQKMQSKVEKMI